MAYDLDGMTLAMEGANALTADDDFAIQPFALVTYGIVVCPVDVGVFLPMAGEDPEWRQRRRRDDDALIFPLVVAFMEIKRGP